MLDTVTKRNALLSAIEKARNSSVIAYTLHDSAMIADDALLQLYDKLHSLGKRERIDLLLHSRVGVVEACWRLLNLLREHCDHLGVIVGTHIYGAGALLALGADEIVMGPLSELGGLETPRKHPLLPRDDSGQPVPTSYCEVRALLNGQGSDGDEQEAEEQAIHVSDTLYNYIHPLAIAHLKQADALSRDVTRKALQMHLHPEDTGRIERIVDLFNGGFHSNLYTPSRSELAELGLPVTQASAELWSLIWKLEPWDPEQRGLVQHYQDAIYTDRPDPTAPGALFRYVCIIESVGRSTGLRQLFTQADGQERVLQMRWETAVRGRGIGPSFGPGGMSNN